jgi:hypothetical protein
MTQREFLTKVAAGEMNDEIMGCAAEALEKMDAANAARREKMAEKSAAKEAEKAPVREAILACIGAEPKTATTLIAEAGVDIKPQSIPSLLKPLVEAEQIVKVDVKVKGKGTQKGYQLAE